MSATSYTHTTISAGPDEPTRIGVSFHLDHHAYISVTGVDVDTPFLSVMHGEVSVRICPRTGELSPADAELARHLADQAAQYADAVERLTQAQLAATDS